MVVNTELRDSQSALKDADGCDVASLEQESNEDDSAFAETADSISQYLFENPVLSDVEIEGTDGTRISAHRSVLASRSQYFLQLFTGEFSEAKSPVVALGFEGAVLKAVVEYCYTDRVSFISETRTDCDDESLVRIAIDLVAAADYFALPTLCTKMIDWATAQMESKTSLVWSFLIEAESSSQADIWITRCREIMVAHPEVCLSLEKDVLSRVSNRAIERILSDDNMGVKESVRFHLVTSWVCASDDSKKRKADAAGLVARHIRLDKISASDIASIVAPSGLLTSSQISDAYKSLATQAEIAGFGPAPGLRVGAHWETTKSCIFQSTTRNHGSELLECEPMQSGTHKWSIEVTVHCDAVILGLACSSTEIDRAQSLRFQQLGWAWKGGGKTYRAGSKGKPSGNSQKFKEGDTVTFTLDLSGPVCLKACVNNGEERTVFNHDDLTMGVRARYSFVPAVSLKSPGAVRFCGFLPVKKS